MIGPGGIFLFYQFLENNDRQGLALAWPRDQGTLPHAERQLAGLAKARSNNQPQPGSNMPIAISNNCQSAFYGPKHAFFIGHPNDSLHNILRIYSVFSDIFSDIKHFSKKSKKSCIFQFDSIIL